MLRKIRIALAAIFFILITGLFLDFTGTLQQYFGWMVKLQFLPAVLALNVVVIIALLALTLAFGRIYCSVICPMGVFQDVVAWISRLFKKKNPYSYSKPKSILRYAVLAVFVVAIVAGVGSFVALLAPYSSYGRIVTNLLQPVYIAGNNVLAGIAEGRGNYDFYAVEYWMRGLPTLIVAVCSLVVVVVLACVGGRTYCNTICPVGTVLGFFARFSWLKPYIDADKCKNCQKCSKNCKAAAINIQKGMAPTIDYSRCVTCGNCLEQCSFGALTYCHPAKGTTPKNSGDGQPADSGRRAFLTATAVATGAAVAKAQEMKVDGGLAIIEDKKIPERQTKLTPPGSLSARNLAKHCTACQLCIAECPNGVLRPSGNLMTLMQPEMSYERGYCRPECTRCSEVCPTGAIKLITKEDKSSTQIGHAVWVKKNCVPLTDGKECGNCERHCPTHAIQMVPSDPNDEKSIKIPVVNIEKCIGCGTCENLCPARPFSAIYVEGHEVHKMI
ncbi:MAG: 4Fe-4S binding protein [Bacteroidaceae bacterium]|nr:4Fe-4S binding protein [Bacteroidaceae bacterium]